MVGVVVEVNLYAFADDGSTVYQAGRDLHVTVPPSAPFAAWKVPARNPHFTGREVVAGRLGRALRSGPVVSLRGIGGVGKSLLAVEHAHRFADEFDVVWWIPAARPASIPDHLVELGAVLGIADPTPVSVLALLHRESRWLLIFDDAGDPGALHEFLPSGSGKVLVTTRRAGFDALGPVLDVGVFDRDESKALLARRLPGVVDEASDELADLLGDLPLAVEQASAYLGTTGLPVADYAALLRTRVRDMLGRGRVADRDDTLATLWDLSLTALAERAPAAVPLLDLLSWLAPEPVPLDLFTAHPEVLPASVADVAADAVAWADTIGALVDLFLVHRDGDHITVAHVLLQHSLRIRQADPRVAHAHCRQLLEADLPAEISPEPDTWPRWRALLPHVLAVCDDAPAGAGTSPWLLGRAGAHLRHRGRPAEAQPLLRRALDAADPEDPDIPTHVHHLAHVLDDLGRPAEAVPLFERALGLSEAAHGPSHPDVATRLEGLAVALSALGRPAEARPLVERALVIREAGQDSAPGDLAATLTRVGNVLIRLGLRNEARPLLERALAIHEAVLGHDHPRLAALLGNIAWLLFSDGRIAEAHVLLDRALTAIEAAYGPEHPDTAQWVSHVGSALSALRRPEDALPYAERALEITQAAYGPDHPDVAVRLASLASVQQRLGRSAQARPLFERALALTEAAHGPQHPAVVSRLTEYGEVLRDLGHPDRAVPLHERALSIAEALHGPDHPRSVLPLVALGSALRDLGRFTEALSLQERALAIVEATDGPEHLNVALRLHDIGFVLIDLGRRAEAGPLFERALDIVKATYGPEGDRVQASLLDGLATVLRDDDPARSLELAERRLTITEALHGPDHQEMAVALTNFATTLATSGRALETLPLYRRAQAILEAQHGPDYIMNATVLGQHALALALLGRHAEAEPLLLRAISISDAVRGPDHPAALALLANLGFTRHALGRPADARESYERALGIAERTGAEPRDRYRIMSSLSVVLTALGHEDEALATSERALALAEEPGADRSGRAEHLAELAIDNHVSGHAELAETLIDRALALVRAEHGPDHPAVFRLLANHGHALRTVNRPSAALPFYERALRAADIDGSPIEQPHLFFLLYAEVLLHEGRPADALPLLERVLGMAETGPDSDEALNVLTLIGHARQQLGMHTEARAALERALGIADALGLPRDPRPAMVRKMLSATLSVLDLPEEARKTLTDALMIAEAALGHDNPLVGAILGELGENYRRGERFREAQLFLERAVRVLEATSGPGAVPVFESTAAVDRRSYVHVLAGLASVTDELGEHSRAAELYTEALTAARDVYPADHPVATAIAGKLDHLLDRT
ncbi:MAG: tetratricopeptide repeat protein [Saccharothrix sp.]|nr:tetratricopeptide repeat protein [Saccharothrix sp.]